MIKVTLEFKSVDEAIVALGKMVGAPQAAVKTGQAHEAAQREPDAGAPTTKPGRKPRADKGQARGEYRPRQGAEPGSPEHQATTTTTQAAKDEAAATEPSPSPSAPTTVTTEAAVVPVAGAARTPSIEQCRSYVERVFNGFGMANAISLLGEYGVKRAQELPADKRLPFIEQALKLLATKVPEGEREAFITGELAALGGAK